LNKFAERRKKAQQLMAGKGVQAQAMQTEKPARGL